MRVSTCRSDTLRSTRPHRWGTQGGPSAMFLVLTLLGEGDRVGGEREIGCVGREERGR